ncbi:DUF6387 family protein [Xenorhabdus sp. XENO-7]|uniref:DUF6387 family protein n=1 Tax=Xenorhabdus aichiensis TaxID=3025874 RepID=A0ABT5M221_9GAMM|nr:DUF6387 family protein [Xenorhabdus aichiensis]MDC9621516.1 DUF6387 family protein [Xenorhabdus aichiensis]
MLINNKSKLPSCFKISNYDEINELNDKDLYRQIYLRRYFFDDEDINNISLDNILHDISNPILNEPQKIYWEEGGFTEERETRAKELSPELTGEIGVLPLKAVEAGFLWYRVKDYFNYIDSEESYSDFEKFWLKQRDINHIPKDFLELDSSIVIQLDLDTDDSLIIDSIKRLLPIWRKDLGINPLNKPISSSWEVLRSKIINYKIIPLLDLLIWEKKTNNKITNGVLAVTLYPDGEFDSINIAQTIRPFLEKILSFYSIEKIRREVSDS